MLIKLNMADLETIVVDGVKEMMALAVTRSEGAKKRGWFKVVKEAIQFYQQRIQHDFLPVLVNDFRRTDVVKFTRGRMSEEDINKIKLFMQMVEKSNIKKIEEELVKKIDNIKVEEWNVGLKNRKDEIKKAVAEGHQWMLRRLDLYVRSVISDEMYKKTVERSKIKVMLYNFTEHEADDSLKKLLENGMDSVPSSRMTKKEVDRRVQDALLEYLQRLGRRRIYGNLVVQASSVQGWIEKMKTINFDNDTKEYLEMIENSLPALQAELDLVYHNVDQDTKEDIVNKLEREGCVMVMCDKNLGMSLFKLEMIRRSEKELMSQLEAVRMENTKEEITRGVLSEIHKFEMGLTRRQEEYINTTYWSRNCEREQISFPFLKIHHKIQKMSEEEIRNKDLGSLKFRPVVDAKQWLTRGYSGLIMQMMREACDKLIEGGGEVFKNIKSKDGWRVAVHVGDYTAKEEHDIIVTADIQEAYSNISDDMIKNAIERVCGFVGYDEWKIELMVKLVDLVLGQNYVETSEGLFKFKKVLPMGYKMSGEALDIVALADEMTVLYNLGEKGQILRVGIGELRSYPEEMVDNSVQREVSMNKAVKSYRRYVDDTHAQIGGTIEEVQDGILAVGFMYPECLTVSLKLNIWKSCHLDVFMWKNITSGRFSTVMKREAEVPVGHVKRGSSHPEKYKLQSLLGEMLRGRRIASDLDLIELSDKCIAHEFESIGYSRWEVQNAMEEAKKKVKEKYSSMFVKIPTDDDTRFFRYGGGIIYNKNYKYGEVFMNYINNIKPQGEPGITFLPDVKIKRLAFTKRRYLAMQEADKKKIKS